jgi:hypothetical protein
VFLNQNFEIDFAKTHENAVLKENTLATLTNFPERGLLHIKQIKHNLTPLSKFPNDEFRNFKEYHEIKNNLQTTILDQPLVEVQRLTRHSNFISDEIKREKLNNTSKFDIYYIPEHLTVLPFTFDEITKLRLVPSIFFRLNSLLNAHKLKLSIEIPSIWIGYVDDPQATWESSIKYHKTLKSEDDIKKVPDGLYEFDESEIIEDKENPNLIEIEEENDYEIGDDKIDSTEESIKTVS